MEGDVEALWKVMQEVLKEMGVETNLLSEKHAQEM